jgi:hypothetical protein
MGDVVDINVPPKKLTRHYKQCKYTVTYIPATKKWHWAVTLVQTTTYGEDADTQLKAFKAAERHIDSVKKSQGVG